MSITKKELAFGLIHNFFEGKVDKAGVDYIHHPLHVAKAVADHGEEYEIVGLLHDIVEDTEVSLEFLRDAGFSNNVVEAVDAITKRKDKDGEIEEYENYLARVKSNKIARIVKLADIEHNSDASRLPEELRKAHEGHLKKYQKAKKYLSD
jgi:(p)ppGpp synthase/HD superfamily hydrolase